MAFELVEFVYIDPIYEWIATNPNALQIIDASNPPPA